LKQEIDVRRVRFAAAVHIHHIVFAKDGTVRENEKLGGPAAHIFENGAACEYFAFGFDADLERHVSTPSNEADAFYIPDPGSPAKTEEGEKSGVAPALLP
jgi:hypothetical protein